MRGSVEICIRRATQPLQHLCTHSLSILPHWHWQSGTTSRPSFHQQLPFLIPSPCLSLHVDHDFFASSSAPPATRGRHSTGFPPTGHCRRAPTGPGAPPVTVPRACPRRDHLTSPTYDATSHAPSHTRHRFKTSSSLPSLITLAQSHHSEREQGAQATTARTSRSQTAPSPSEA